MRKLFLIMNVILLASFEILSQVNTERFRKSQDSLGFGGQGSVSFNVQAGNTDLQILKGQIRINYNGGSYYAFIVTGGDFGWQGGEQVSNEAIVHLRHVRTLTSFFQIEFFGQIDYSKPRKLNIRQVAGTSLRMRIYRTPLVRLYGGIGLMYEDEKYDLPEGSVHPLRTSILRSTNYLSAQINFTAATTFFSTIYYQPDPGALVDYKILGENGFSTALSEAFSLSASVTFRIDKRPPDGIKDYDVNTELGVGYSF